ncbi:helix-turn-helix domain-containing protein [Rhodopirellula sp. JC639]|uniref:helix-turn-helix domain-containing protein n=1 Tax=Stieleria mannarensis TaxID=2755585 RepID=UPI0016005FCF|nr:helix-turn-helix transcriptional regulator [Rhodopirellula sp. JC639]
MTLLDHTSYRIRPNRLRSIRHGIGLSQTQLAAAAGYSSRLIRKAESVGRLSGAAVKDIVQALRERGADVDLDDLLFDELLTAKRFMECFQQYGAACPDHCRDLFADAFTFRSAGNFGHPLFVPDCDIEGLHLWFNRIFSLLHRDSTREMSPRYLVGDHAITARVDLILIRGGQISLRTWMNFHFDIRHGLIHRLEIEYDTQAVLEFALAAEAPA